MSCAEDRKNVRKFLEDLLDEPEYQRMRRHVEGCDSCAQFVRAAGSVSSMLMELGRLNAPDDLPDAVVYRYGVKRRAAHAPAAATEQPPAPAQAQAEHPAPVSGGGSGWIKIVAVLLALTAGGLAWRDWVQTRLLETLLVKDISSAAPAAAVPAHSAAVPFADFQWGHVRLEWPSANRESLLALLRRFSGDIRYEAPGWVAVRIPAAQDELWRSALREFPDATIAAETASPDISGDRLYSIRYGEG
jgi:hypothetical protein